ncbi:PTS sugar transporter subunit IIA [Clostridium paraputrificum]|uniref:PTS sugar transporter subunit IIA n=1 Tax=Clostridium paraputrificum TaxID=29363 RepID=UPI003D32810D
MYKIVVASHGKFSESCLETIKFFYKETENISTISLDNEGIEKFERSVKELFNEIKDSNVLIFVDLLHGTPFNVCSENIGLIKGETEMVSGVNVPMLLEAALNSESMSVSESVENIKNTQYINILSEELEKISTNEDDE